MRFCYIILLILINILIMTNFWASDMILRKKKIGERKRGNREPKRILLIRVRTYLNNAY